MKKKEPTGPLILIGQEEEIFYQLGLKDSLDFSAGLTHFEQFMATNNTLVDKAVGVATDVWTDYLVRQSPTLHRNLRAYSEGLGLGLSKALKVFAMPEILSALDKFLPSMQAKSFACSSLFHCHDGMIDHFRILDFPLVGTYDKNAQTILMKIPKAPEIFFFTTKGLPYPGLTAMNSEGLTVALHQKYNRMLNKSGQFIFDIVFNLLKTCRTQQDVLSFLKSQNSLTAWGLYISTSDNKVLEVDIQGKHISHQSLDYEEGRLLYFNNSPLENHDHFEDIAPYGMNNYCSMRKEVMNKKIQKLKDPDVVKIFKEFARPKVSKAQTAKNWQVSPTTISTIETVCLSPKTSCAYSVPGKAPKILLSDLNFYENVFDRPKASTLKVKGKFNHEDYIEGLRYFSIGQSYFDQKMPTEGYHYLQMAQDFLKPYSDYYVVHFYFLLYEYIHNDNQIEWPYLLQQLYEIKDDLPEFLKEQCLLLIFKLEKVLNHPLTISEDDFLDENLRKQFQHEALYPQLVLKRLRKFIYPRPEILDVISIHVPTIDPTELIELVQEKLASINL